MYHTIDDLCKKIDVIKEKADTLRLHNKAVDVGFEEPDPAIIQYELADIRALCADIVNDRGGEDGF